MPLVGFLALILEKFLSLLSSLLIIILMVKKFVYKEGNCCYAKANGC